MKIYTLYGYFDKDDNFIEDEDNSDGEEYLRCEFCKEVFPIFDITEVE